MQTVLGQPFRQLVHILIYAVNNCSPKYAESETGTISWKIQYMYKRRNQYVYL